jgi:hypothetical protein
MNVTTLNMTTLDGGNVIIKKGEGGSSGDGSAEEKFGFVFLTKEAAVTGMLGGNMPESIPQDQLMGVMEAFCSIGLVATKKNGWDIDPICQLSENIGDGRFTYENWDAIALNLDALTFNDRDYNNPWIPIWKTIAPTIAEAKQGLAQIFPTQITEEEFLKDTTD